jgi:hypothetical protein
MYMTAVGGALWCRPRVNDNAKKNFGEKSGHPSLLTTIDMGVLTFLSDFFVGHLV